MNSNELIMFRRLRAGGWGVVGPERSVKPGLVRVTKKDGTVTLAVVERVGDPFEEDNQMKRIGYLRERGT